MSDKLDRLTDRARRVLTQAQEAAYRFNHDYIGPEHMLLGITQEEGGAAIQILRALGVTPEQVIQAVERATSRGGQPVPGKPTLSPQAKQVIELAVDEARLLGHAYIDTEHLLAGIVRADKSVATQALDTLGIGMDNVRTQTARYILQSQAQRRQGAQRPEERRPWEEQLSHDLTAAAEEGKLEPLIGRQSQLDYLIQILGRRTKNNPLLIGEAGVGKRTLVKGLAQRMSNGQVPASLLNRRLLVLDVGNLVTSIIYRHLIGERMNQMLDECTSSGALLFIDNAHTLVGPAGSKVDTANFLKYKLSRGELQAIGATTPAQYHAHMQHDAERDWHFRALRIQEPSLDETLAILHGVKSRYEAHHKLSITNEALHAAVHLAARFVPDRHLPDKAIDLIDEAGSLVHMNGSTSESTELKVTPEDIAAVVSLWTGESIDRLTEANEKQLPQEGTTGETKGDMQE